MSPYPAFLDELSVHGIDLHPSELHGMLVGYLCAVQKDSQPAQRAALYAEWLGNSTPAVLVEMLEAECSLVLEHLDEFADFEFRLLTPADGLPIGERAAALAAWCSGFLSGFGQSGRTLDAMSDSTVQEVLQDLGRIAAMTAEVPEGEDNESDLTEIEEFIRVSTLLVFAECGGGSRH